MHQLQVSHDAARTELDPFNSEGHVPCTSVHELAQLPHDILFEILALLGPSDFLQLRKTCKKFAAMTRERVVWIRAIRHEMHKHGVPEEKNFVQPACYSAVNVEAITLRPWKFRAALAQAVPMAVAQHDYILRTSSKFTVRAISNVIYGRWMAVASDTATDPPGVPLNLLSWHDAEGQIVLWDLGHGHGTGVGIPVPKMSLTFRGKVLLVDLVALPNTEMVFLGCAYGRNRRESMYEGHIISLNTNSFGKVDTESIRISASTITESSFCGEEVALDIADGVICVFNYHKNTVGLLTCRQLASRHGSIGKSMQLTPTTILVADNYHARVFALPRPTMVALRENLFLNVLMAEAVQLIALPVDVLPLNVRFLPLPRSMLGEAATLHVYEPSKRRHSFMHFSCKPVVFGDPWCVTYSVPEHSSDYSHVSPSILRIFGLSHTVQSALCVRTEDSLITVTLNLDSLSIVAVPAFDEGVFAKEVESAMDGVELAQGTLRPLVALSDFGWIVLAGSLIGGNGPKTKRAGVVLDELGGRVVLLEARDGQHRVRITEYV